jgi:hypothetical protein
MWYFRLAAGAIIGAVVSLGALMEAGAIWGAIVRPAPCYVGGDPPRLFGALFGMMALPAFFGPYGVSVAAPVGAAIGCILPKLTALFRRSGFRL